MVGRRETPTRIQVPFTAEGKFSNVPSAASRACGVGEDHWLRIWGHQREMKKHRMLLLVPNQGHAKDHLRAKYKRIHRRCEYAAIDYTTHTSRRTHRAISLLDYGSTRVMCRRVPFVQHEGQPRVSLLKLIGPDECEERHAHEVVLRTRPSLV